MRYTVLLGTLFVSLDCFGASIANAIPTNGNASAKANSIDVIKGSDGCGARHAPNKKTGKCEPY